MLCVLFGLLSILFINCPSHCIKGSPRWETRSFADRQLPLLCKPKVHCIKTARHFYLSWTSLINFELYQTIYFAIHFNIITSSKWSVSFRFPLQNSVCITLLPLTFPSHSLCLLRFLVSNKERRKQRLTKVVNRTGNLQLRIDVTLRRVRLTIVAMEKQYVVGSKSFQPDQLFKVTEIKQLCYFST